MPAAQPAMKGQVRATLASRMVAAFVEDPALVTAAQMDRWAGKDGLRDLRKWRKAS